MIVAPHPDDETLGCGGIICKKILAGAAISFVFVTDGGSSHSHSISREDLVKTRETEAREAVLRLGGNADEISFLRHPDSDASTHVDQIAADILYLLQRKKPQSVFIPHVEDFPSDHAAVNAATVEALRIYGRPVTVYDIRSGIGTTGRGLACGAIFRACGAHPPAKHFEPAQV